MMKKTRNEGSWRVFHSRLERESCQKGGAEFVERAPRNTKFRADLVRGALFSPLPLSGGIEGIRPRADIRDRRSTLTASPCPRA